jgi:6-phosphogluconolactonase
MIGELRVVQSVPTTFAEIVTSEMARVLGERADTPSFRLGASGGGSGGACFAALAGTEGIDWARLALYFVDERCVDVTSPDSNQHTIAQALGSHLPELAGFYPMSCELGAAHYEALLREAGPLHLCQLGLGPDGHTASIFPNSPALEAPGDRLVVENHDLSGRNVHDRLSLTFAALAQAERLVVTVMGPDKADALARIDAGEDLPATRVDSPLVLWLVDEPASSKLPGTHQA